MATLTRKQRAAIEYALRNAERARAYLFSDSVAIARKGGVATTSLHYARVDGAVLYEVEKAYGSDLTGLDSAIGALRSFLNPPVESA